MRRELFLHLSLWFAFFVFITLIRQYFNVSYWPFWLGGIVGIFLPDIDRLISIHISKTQELIFHTILFQIIFLVLTFWIMSSSGSLFGQGLVLSFALHLAIDQLVDLNEMGSLNNWFKDLPFTLNVDQSKTYWMVTTVIVLIFGFFL